MEGLAHAVAESMVRHGFEPSFDHRRLQWSTWFHCHDSFSLVVAPCKPGIFALGEEVMAPGELAVGEGKRMLALFQIREVNDLGMALGRLFLSRSLEHDRLASGRCFARYVVIEDAAQRRTAFTALQRWMASSAETVLGTPQATWDDNHVAPDAPVREAEPSSTGSPSGSDAQLAGFASEQAGFVSGNDTGEARFVPGHDFSRAADPAILTSALDAAPHEPADASSLQESSNRQAQIGPPLPIPSGF